LWRAYPEEGCYNTGWLMGLWSTQAKVEGTVLKAAWHWGIESSVVNDPLGEPGHTSLFVGLPSTLGLWTVTKYFSQFLREGSLLGTLIDINE
jgi:hypothetical protein